VNVVTFSNKMDVLKITDGKAEKQKQATSNNSQVDVIAENAIALVNEINDSLTIIKGYLQFLEKGSVNNRQEWLSIVFQEINRVELLVNNFIKVSQDK
jgi:nitrogen-specific signal transduction histidine kinase